jgi:hypothetical protein
MIGSSSQTDITSCPMKASGFTHSRAVGRPPVAANQHELGGPGRISGATVPDGQKPDGARLSIS